MRPRIDVLSGGFAVRGSEVAPLTVDSRAGRGDTDAFEAGVAYGLWS